MRSGTTRRFPIRFELATAPPPAADVASYTLVPLVLHGVPLVFHGVPVVVRVRS